MERSSNAPLRYDLPGQRDRRYATIVIPDQIGNTGLLDGFGHLLRLSAVHGEWFLTEDDLARSGGGKGDLIVSVIGRGDVNGVNVAARDQPPPVRLHRFPTPPRGEI